MMMCIRLLLKNSMFLISNIAADETNRWSKNVPSQASYVTQLVGGWLSAHWAGYASGVAFGFAGAKSLKTG
jgi:hypothetical protein